MSNFTMTLPKQQNISTNGVDEALEPLAEWASCPDAFRDIGSIFGLAFDIDCAVRHLAAWEQRDYSLLPPVSVLPAVDMPGLWGGYSRELNRIFISDQCPPERLSEVLIEEVGHFLDREICATETPGEEGAKFAALVLGVGFDVIEADDAPAFLCFEGQGLLVEAARRKRGKRGKRGSGKSKKNKSNIGKAGGGSKKRNKGKSKNSGVYVKSRGAIGGYSGEASTASRSVSSSSSTRKSPPRNNSWINQLGSTGSLKGTFGDDTFTVSSVDVIIQDPGGTDTVRSPISFDLSQHIVIENLELIGSGDINGSGNFKNNSILGNSGNNFLDGGGGFDTLAGGLGDDTYVYRDTLDLIIEKSGEGSDTIASTLNFSSLADFSIENVENLSFIGEGSATLSGNDLANVLTGGTQADTFYGGEGDTLIGWHGSDFYYVSSVTTKVLELDDALGGNDTISTDLWLYSIAAAKNVEVLVYTGTRNSSLFGNTGNNTIYGALTPRNTINGGDGDDYLFGGDTTDSLFGGAGDDTLVVTRWNDTPIGALGTTLRTGRGSDTLAGGEGDDWYVVNSQTAYTYQDSNGDNTVASTVSFSLKYNPNIAANVQNLYLIGDSNSDQLGTGSDTANLITGSDGNNYIEAGAGNDTVLGGLGGDTIKGQAGDDSIIGGGQPQGDLPAGPDTPIELGLGQVYQGRIEFRQDTDWIRVSLRAGSKYYFRVEPDFSQYNPDSPLVKNSDVAFGMDSADLSVSAGQGNIGLIGDPLWLFSHDFLVLKDAENAALGILDPDDFRRPSDRPFSESADMVFGPNNIRAFSFTAFDDGDFYIPVTGGGPATGSYKVYFSDNAELLDQSSDDLADDALSDVLADDAANVLIGGLGKDTLVSTSGRDAEGNYVGDTLMGGTNGIPGGIDTDSVTGENEDSLVGGKGGDMLDGGRGIDIMVGGQGNDTYFVDDALDTIEEDDAGGVDDLAVVNYAAGRDFSADLAAGFFALQDKALSSLTGAGFDVDLGRQFSNVEHASLMGSANLYVLGNSDPNSLHGNFGDNLLAGEAGNDSLLGEGGDDYLIGGDGGDLLNGGSGLNTMDGGFGDDTYIVNDRSDRVINEIAGLDGGIDLVRTNFNFDPIQGSELEQFQPNQPDNSPSNNKAHSFASEDIKSFYNLENFELLGDAVYGVGNALGNSLVVGENSLSGGEPAALLLGMGGEDTLVGKAGNDSLYGDTPDFYASPDLYAPAPVDTRNREFLDSVIGAFGSDYLDGGDGDDYLDGGKSFDTMIGGAGDDTFVQDNVDDYVIAGDGDNELISSVNIAKAPDDIRKLMLVVADQSPDSGQEEVASFASFVDSNSVDVRMELMYAPREADRFVVGGVTDTSDAPGNPDVHDLSVSLYYDDLDFPGRKKVDLSWVAGEYADTGVVGYTVRYKQLTNSDGSSFSDDDGNPDIWHTYVNGTSQDFQGWQESPTLTIRNLADGTYDFEVIAYELAIPALKSRTWDSARHVTLQGGVGDDDIYGWRVPQILPGGLVSDVYTNPLLQNNPLAPLPLGFIFNPDPYNVKADLPDRFATYLDGGFGNDYLDGDYVNDGSGDDYTFQNVVFKGLNTLVGGQGSDTFVVKNGGNATINGNGGKAISDEFDWVVKYGNETPVDFGAGGVGESLNGGQHNLVVSMVDYLILSDDIVSQGMFIDRLQVNGGFGMGNRLENYVFGHGTLVGNTSRDSIEGNLSGDLLIGGTAYGKDDVGMAVRDFAGVVYGGYGLVESVFRDTDPVPTDPNGPGAADPSQFWNLPGYYGTVYDPNRNQDTLIANASSTLDGGAGRDSLVGSGSSDMFYVSQGWGGLSSQSIASQDAVFGNGGNDTVMFTDSDYLWWTGHEQGAVLDKNSYSIERWPSESDISNLILQAGSPSARNAIGNNDSKGNPGLGSNVIVGNEFDNVIDGGGVGGDNESGTGVDVLIGGSGSDNFVVQGYTSSDTNEWSPEIIDYEEGDLAGFSVWIPGESTYIDADYAVIKDFEAGDNLQLAGGTSSYWIGSENTFANLTGGRTGAIPDDIPPYIEGGISNIDPLDYLETPNPTRFGIYTAGVPNLVAIVNLVGGLELDTLSLELAYDPAPTNIVATNSSFRAHLGYGTFWELDSSSFAKYVNQAYTPEDSFASLETLVRSGDDTFTGGPLADFYNGYGGNDSLLGGGGDDTLLGESGNDRLFGEAGDDSLLGGKDADFIDGGLGADVMVGSLGDDTYIVDSLADVVTETDADTLTGGVDWVSASVDGYSLTANVENLTLLSPATSGTGNALGNRLTGNSSNNILTGLDGNDTLIGLGGVNVLDGGADDDYYIVDANTDTILDSGGFADTLQSSVEFDLSNPLVAGGTEIENLIYTGSSGVSLTGNELDNSITGSAGSDTLDGQDGTDTLIGGAGDDYYVLTTSDADLIVEEAGSGTDTVLIDGSFSISPWEYLENIELTAAVASILTGNSQDNMITGNVLNDNISGGGGNDTLSGTSAAGNGEIDTLTGGAGADLFVLGDSLAVFYNDLPGVGDYAFIRDFDVEQSDRLQLKNGATYLFAEGNIFGDGIGGANSYLYNDTNLNSEIDGADRLIAAIIATGGAGENKNLLVSDLAKIAIYA